MATYYIDYVAGNDSNSGTSTAAPWKHCPGMAPFSGSYTHSDGDQFIFKGGVTWPNAALPLLIADRGGASGNPDIYGAVDQTWYSGGSWSRAIFDGEGVEFTNYQTGSFNDRTQTSGNVIMCFSDQYITIEAFEIKNFVWSDQESTNQSDGWAVMAYSCNYVTVKNVYSHDWVIATTVDEKYGGIAGHGTTVGMVAEDCIVEGPTSINALYVTDTGPWVGAPEGMEFTSGCGYNSVQTVINCEVRYTTQGIFGGASVCEGNLIEWCCNSFNSTTHENALWLYTGTASGNMVRNIGEGVTCYLLPGWGGTPGTITFYNNVLYNLGLTGSINPVNCTNQAVVAANDNNIYVYNNILEHDAGFNLGTAKVGDALDDLRLRNNITINSTGNIYTVVDSEANDYPVNTIDYNYNTTLANFEAVGALESADFAPTQSIASVTDSGFDLSAVFTDDYLGNSRTAGWDIGPYEFVSGDNNPKTGGRASMLAVLF